MVPASSKKFLDIQANYRVWIRSEIRTWHDNMQWKNESKPLNTVEKRIQTFEYSEIAKFEDFSVYTALFSTSYVIDLLLQFQFTK